VGGAFPPDGHGGEFACGWMATRDVLREHFLQSLAGDEPGAPSVRSSVEATITWRNNDQYLRDLSALIDQEQVLFKKLSGRLTDLGLMNADETKSARPLLHLQISDERSNKPSNLPAIQNTDGNVKIAD
jgi:hypothetical protein